MALFGPVIIEPMRHLEIDASFATLVALFTIGAFVVARWRPTIAVALLFVTNEIEWTHVHGAFALTISVMVGSAVGIAFLTQPALLQTLERPAVRIVGIGFAAVALATTLSGVFAGHRELVGAELIKLLEYAITFLIAHAAFAARRDERLATTAVALAAIVVSLSALVQLFTGAPAGLSLGSLVVPRIAGLLAGPNQLAGYLGLLYPVLLITVLETRSRLARAALGLLLLALLFTFSRGGFIGLAVATLVVVQFRGLSARFRAVLVTVGALAVGVALAALASGTLGRMLRADEIARPDGLGTRTELWHAALALFRRSPIFGIGAGNFETSLVSVGYPDLHTHANSWFFESLADGGLVLVAATIVWIRQTIVVLLRAARREPFALGALAATAGFAAHGLFDDLVFYPTVAAAWWLVVGVGAGLADNGEIERGSESTALA